jgi:hypothetical protein
MLPIYKGGAMFKTTIAAAALAAAVVNLGYADSLMLEQGRQDRATWEQWFNSLQGDYNTGAFFWASQRSLSHPGSCQQMSDDFYAGCTQAKVTLSASDTLRKAEPDYKAGWNAWIPSSVTTSSVAAPMLQNAPPVVPPSPSTFLAIPAIPQAAQSPMIGAQPVQAVIESRIDSEFHGWDGDTVYKLMNGQIWQQASYHYDYHYAYSPSVLIYPSAGGYKMHVEGDSDQEIAVRRLR